MTLVCSRQARRVDGEILSSQRLKVSYTMVANMGYAKSPMEPGQLATTFQQTLSKPICVLRVGRGSVSSDYTLCQPSNRVNVQHRMDEGHLIETESG